jgi:lipoprotein-anchoring transpeptidase ErfK/SrfK
MLVRMMVRIMNRRILALAILIFACIMFAGTPPRGMYSQAQSVAYPPLARSLVSDVPSVSGSESESARSDKLTGGKIERSLLAPGNSDIKISINLPAFLLTLWQDGKQVVTYDIGIGRKSHPVPVGERSATEIVFNPNWIPPDSPWVRKSYRVRPGEVIQASNPRNPLGKLKIPLGDAYLIHQADRRSDIGRLVSHGCVRMRKDDIFDLAEKIITARDLPVSSKQLANARKGHARRVVQLNEPLPVDINYDTLVVEARTLHIYPDVYKRGTNSAANLRAELEAEGVNISKLTDRTLKSMLAQVNPSSEFVVNIADIENGRALAAGRDQPLPGHSAPRKGSRK